MDSSNPCEVLLCINIGDDFLYIHISGEKSFNMLISFVEEDFFETLIGIRRPHFELRTIVFTDSFDK
ncbi:hypothetical protein CB17B0385 [Clostridium botulinum B str. Eklund 17B (NRP)]|nr:hypothetical protein CB17B0385 [Clostridium botulinum B str. Eklund 17B (NRP)]